MLSDFFLASTEEVSSAQGCPAHFLWQLQIAEVYVLCLLLGSPVCLYYKQIVAALTGEEGIPEMCW